MFTVRRKTRAQYDAIPVKDPDILYIVMETDETFSLYLGGESLKTSGGIETVDWQDVENKPELQEKLVAGNNITINPITNVISASGGELPFFYGEATVSSLVANVTIPNFESYSNGQVLMLSANLPFNKIKINDLATLDVRTKTQEDSPVETLTLPSGTYLFTNSYGATWVTTDFNTEYELITQSEINTGTSGEPKLINAALLRNSFYDKNEIDGMVASTHDIEVVTGTTLTITQALHNKTIIFTSNNAVTVIITTQSINEINQGFFCDLVQYGDGEVVFNPAGVILNSVDGKKKINGKFVATSLIKITEENEWLLIGGLKE